MQGCKGGAPGSSWEGIGKTGFRISGFRVLGLRVYAFCSLPRTLQHTITSGKGHDFENRPSDDPTKVVNGFVRILLLSVDIVK